MPRPRCWRVVWGGVEPWVLNYESEKQQGKGLDLDTAELSSVSWLPTKWASIMLNILEMLSRCQRLCPSNSQNSPMR